MKSLVLVCIATAAAGSPTTPPATSPTGPSKTPSPTSLSTPCASVTCAFPPNCDQNGHDRVTLKPAGSNGTLPCCATYACITRTPTSAPAPTQMPTIPFNAVVVPNLPFTNDCLLGGNHCGGRSPKGCYCDAFCSTNNDCCQDYTAACGVYHTSNGTFTAPAPTPKPYQPVMMGAFTSPLLAAKPKFEGFASCEKRCGLTTPTTVGKPCYCDHACETTNDCCPDKIVKCGAPPKPPTPLPNYSPYYTSTFWSGTQQQLYLNYLHQLSSENQQSQVGTSYYFGSSNNPVNVASVGSCVGNCGTWAAGAVCMCDSACAAKGDCCKDYSQLCA
mmetsp:Transcript_50326/g.98640  ORF Transcript_50326/g.98640 Transcript_50326/m.98640 type:complete len:330 (-) Transcript_50326:192-1181(-)